MPKMPVLFLGHGSPMYAIEPNEHTQAWQELAEQLPLPKAILAISAHWYTRGIWLTSMARPNTIHDFGGFPEALFDIQYPAPGSPELAKKVKALLEPIAPHAILEESEWGLDHGTWSVLKYLYPKANIPVVQMSLDASLTEHEHFKIAEHLKPLRDEEVLIISSGNVVHNLKAIRWQNSEPPYDWALSFNQFFKEHLNTLDFEPLLDWRHAGHHAAMAVPSSEHYLPAVYTLGLHCGEEMPAIITDGIEMSSISMLSFAFGVPPLS